MEALVEVILYRDICQGKQWAKVVVLLASLYYAYTGTQLAYGYLVGVAFRHFDGWALLMLFRVLLTLAALVLMFKQPRVAVA